MKKVYLLVIALLYFSTSKINALTFDYSKEVYATNRDNNISIYKNNVLFKSIDNAELVKLNELYVVYIKENSLYLLNLNSNEINFIDDSIYYVSGNNEYVVYEKKSNLLCKDYLTNLKDYCSNIFIYNIENKQISNILANNYNYYLNDISEKYFSFTIIGYNNISSSVGVYEFKNNRVRIFSNYQGGNSFLFDENLVFETTNNTCKNNTIINLSLIDERIVSYEKDICFNDFNLNDFIDNRVYFTSSDYTYFSEFKDKYVFNIDSNKFIKIENGCSYNNDYLYYNKDIVCYDFGLKIYKVDNIAPSLKKDYYILLEDNKDEFLTNLEILDNFDDRKDLKVNGLSNIVSGNKQINICDSFNNCADYNIFIELVKKDDTAPHIRIDDTIYLRVNEKFIVSDYGFGYDDIDGKVQLKIKNGIDTSKKGIYVIRVECEDKSGNISYKNIKLVIYSYLSFKYIYYFLIILLAIIIIFINKIKFKKIKKK